MNNLAADSENDYNLAEKILGKEKLVSILNKNSYLVDGSKILKFSGNIYHLALFTVFIEDLSSRNLEIEEKQQYWLKWRTSPEGTNLDLEGITLSEVDFEGAILDNINFQEADIINSTFKYAKMQNCNFEEATFSNNLVKGCNFIGSKLSYTIFNNSNLFENKFNNVNFNFSSFDYATLSENDFSSSNFEYSSFYDSIIENNKVNSKSSFNNIYIDKDAYIINFNVEIIQADSKSRSLLKYIIRRSHWDKWCKKFVKKDDKLIEKYNIKKVLFVKPFWILSDYGYSTIRPLCFFFFNSLVFAFTYFLFAGFSTSWDISNATQSSGPIYNLFPSDVRCFSFIHLFIRSLYFSIVTMTSLGFGDLFANSNSIIGMLLLIIQVLIGYFMLAILVTRLSTLFNSDGPTYVPIKKKSRRKKEKTHKI